MNYYERIQKSIDYIESCLENKINIDFAAQTAYMSLSNFYRMFFALTGHSVKEYIRLRRISLGAFELRNRDTCLIDIAIKFDFESGDSFSRAFRRVTGFLPSDYRKQKSLYNFERIDIMEKYFDIQDKELIENYPDIKVLKELEPTRAAYFCYYGKEPEHHAFAVMAEWLNKNGLNINEQKLRIFGYNNPNPSSPNEEEYGYEVCVTVADNIVVNDDLVKEKILGGGLYAVTNVKRGQDGDIGGEIVKAWNRFKNWISDSKYVYGGHQWLEEHLGFDDNANHIGGIDLYMPIALKSSDYDITKTFDYVDSMLTATYTATGKDADDKARAFFLKWADSQGLFNDGKTHRFFAYYDHEKIGHKDFFYKIHVTVDEEFRTDNRDIKLEEFTGGYYAIMKAKYSYNGWAWGEFLKWLSKSTEFDLGNYWFFEEYKLNKPELDMDTEVVLHMPVKQKV
ncbi:transcription activator effector binding [Ruminiclostridium papyrosolvens DSM 2782]|uniref:Transcription activator effector binding n=1 Tax=Ruminiclostridium papyrosolvens DSM 2782 TaxID=588581 RepID=F1TCZ2_9FIRM|nr:effector binding domain-containing protein [Ruminiclostridium papyrosolvens]EGD47859.1 transcription activator effector binding [Ruminiclostridium papyrosolvens DSM 2782]WES34573.1 effector binding domain-containing protein [Ruminiclostridium papyrosolvens DSM 2782]